MMGSVSLEDLRARVPQLDSIPIRVSNLIPSPKKFQQVAFPKTRKKRIRKKWAKNRGNYQVVDVRPVFFLIQGVLYTNVLGLVVLRNILTAHENEA